MKAELINFLEDLGNIDPLIRDEGAYSKLSEFIRSDENNPQDNRALFNHLMEGIDTKGFEIDAILKRSFSYLTLSNVIFEDHQRFKSFNVELKKVFEKVSQNIINETCFEDRSDEYGWIHCFAHAGDVFSTLVIHQNTDKSEATKICDFIYKFPKENLSIDSRERFEGPIQLANGLGKI